MTERPTVQRSAPPPGAVPPARSRTAPVRRRPGPGAVIWGSVASFAVLFGFLTSQLRSGNDPALGAAAVAPGGKPQKVLVRRVIHRRVVTTVIPSPSSSGGGSGGTSVSQAVAQPVTSAAPPSPAPAPVTTSAS